MRIIRNLKLRFRWIFSDSGHVRMPKDGKDSEVTIYLKGSGNVQRRVCKVCRDEFWCRKRKKTTICKKFSCFKSLGGWW